MKVLIIGGGISGLSAAWFLRDKAEVTLLEQSERCGGWIRTIRKDGFLFDCGPRGCRPNEVTLDLARELGLGSSIITAPEEVHKRYLYVNQRLRCLPSSFGSFMRDPFYWPAALSLLREFFVKPSPEADESIYDFGCRRLGRFVTETFLDPMVLGIYGGDLRSLSLRSCFPSLWKMEQESGGLLRGMLQKKAPKEKVAALFSFKDGMQQLTDALRDQIPGDLQLGTEVLGMSRDGHGWRVQTNKGEFQADVVISTVSLTQLAKWLPDLPISASPTVSMTVVNLGWKQNCLHPKGFGHLVPTKEREPVLGMVWDSCVFPQQNNGAQTRITVMMRESGTDVAQAAVKKQLGIQEEADTIHSFRAKNAIPQYQIGHFGRLEKLENYLSECYPNLLALGTGLHGVAVNDCIANAKSLSSELKKNTALHKVTN